MVADARQERNPGIGLDLDWIREIRVNHQAVHGRAVDLTQQRSVHGTWQVAWLLKAITLMDLTTLSGDDTPGFIKQLAAKAVHPIRPEILSGLGMEDVPIHTAALCVYHSMIPAAQEVLTNTGIPIAVVSAGFPAGLSPLETRLREIELSVASGVQEIDVVINRSLVLTGQWQELYDEVKAFRQACGAAMMKTIIATGDLKTLRNVARASLVCMMAGSDFIKTSTGKESTNATLPVGLTMVRAIRDYAQRTGFAVGFKAAGGLRRADQALHWLFLMKEELGDAWVEPNRFRLGASSLLGSIERELERQVGRFGADTFRHPLG